MIENKPSWLRNVFPKTDRVANEKLSYANFSLSGPPSARAEVTPRVAGGSKWVIHPSFPQTSLAIKSWLPQTSEFGVTRCEARAKLGPIASGVVDLPLKVFFPSSEAHGKREKSRLKSSLKLSSAARARGR